MAPDVGHERARSTTWFGRSMDRILAPGAAATRGRNAPLRDLFTDLIAYVLLFQASCETRSPTMGEVRDRILGLVAEQEKRVKAGEAPWEPYREALYAVLSWADEIILNSAWTHRTQWRHLMLTSFGTLNAGEQFFQRLESLPADARDIREVYYLCLQLGFEGTYALGESTGQFRDLRRRLYRQVARAPEDLRQRYQRLFPEAYRRPRADARPHRRVHPAWFALILLLPVILFAAYAYILRRDTDRLIALIAAAPLEQPIPPQEPRRTLVEELRARGIEAHDSARGVVITLPNLLFEVSSSDLSPAGERKIGEVAAALKLRAPGVPVAVEGHASREKATPEDRNQRLSEDRATRVAETLVGSGLRHERVTASGFGSRRPIASNDTEDGRRQNRRVEIIAENVRN
jgi:type VI secretion system protein ImpK